MFERQYVLVSFDWTDRTVMTNQINAVVALHDHDRAAASIACVSHDAQQFHVLIEKWRDGGDAEQDTAGAVDDGAAARQTRRPRAAQNNDAGTTAGVEPEGLDLPLGAP